MESWLSAHVWYFTRNCRKEVREENKALRGGKKVALLCQSRLGKLSKLVPSADPGGGSNVLNRSRREAPNRLRPNNSSPFWTAMWSWGTTIWECIA